MSSTYQVGCYGKLPFYGDYLRILPSHFPLAQFESWFAAGNLGTERQDGRLLAYDSSPPGFAMFPAQGRWWAIAIFSSQDQVGRRYPFILCADIPNDLVGDEVGLVPALFAGFFQQAYMAAVRGWPTTIDDLKALLQSLAGAIDPARDAQVIANALTNIKARDLWTALLGRADDPRCTSAVTQVINLATGSRTGWGIRLQPSVHQSHVSFWLWFISTLRNHSRPPDLIVMHPGQQGHAPASFLLYDRASPETCFAALWPRCSIATFDSGITDLANVGSPQGQPLGEELDSLLSQPGLSLRDLLHALSTWWRGQQPRSRLNAGR
jgi:type VI secretion system ImpM family protein